MKRIIKYFLAILILTPYKALACSWPNVETVFGGCYNPKDTTALEDFIREIFMWSVGIIGTLAMLGLILAGFTYSTANGNPEQIKKAKDIIITSITGLVIILTSFALITLLGIEV